MRSVCCDAAAIIRSGAGARLVADGVMFGKEDLGESVFVGPPGELQVPLNDLLGGAMAGHVRLGVRGLKNPISMSIWFPSKYADS